MPHFPGSSDDSIVVLIAAHQADLSAYIHSLLPGDPSVDDVLQRTNLVVWRKRRSFEKGTNFLAWACAVARWEASAHLKQCRRRSWVVLGDDLVRMVPAAAGIMSLKSPAIRSPIFVR